MSELLQQSQINNNIPVQQTYSNILYLPALEVAQILDKQSVIKNSYALDLQDLKDEDGLGETTY